MQKPDYLRTSDFKYELPNDKVALYPVEPRDASKLLVYRHGEIADSRFSRIPELLPPNTLLIVNDTAVVNARLVFQTAEHQRIEIFLLEPSKRSWEDALENRNGEMEFEALIGNKRKWKTESLTQSLVDKNRCYSLNVSLLSDVPPFRVKLTWSPGLSLREVMDLFGKVPLPPYIRRDAEELDRNAYQTVYAAYAGSVAAPTAGLHFTQDVVESLAAKGCTFSRVTLHVGAGTFRPVDAENALQHEMHAEEFSITADTLVKIVTYLKSSQPVAAVGTTSLRTLESLHAAGRQVLNGVDLSNGFNVSQFEAYDPGGVSIIDTLNALISVAEKRPDKKLHGKTKLMIVPGFKFRIVDHLITNFHQPGSTLLMLVSAFIGDDWKKVYNYALQNGYRFLSYGDSSLLNRVS